MMKRHLALLLGTLFGSWPCLPAALGGGGPENVVLVVNGDSWASKTVANHYARLRKVPASHVVWLSNVPDFERVDVETFRQRILRPVLKALDDRNLKPQIDYVVYSCDLPWSIDARADLQGQNVSRALTPIASINGLTFLYERVLAGEPSYLNLNSNRYMRRPLPDAARKPISRDDLASYQQAMERLSMNELDEAAKILTELTDKYPQQAALLYNLACCRAKQGKADEAVTILKQAVEAGWSNRKHAEADADLESLRERKDFADVLARMDRRSQAVFDVQPTVGFSGQATWNEGGEIVPDGGQRYLLSTMLAVTSGRGNSVEEAIAALSRAAAADATSPRGTIYFPTNSNVRSTTRDKTYESAAAALKKLDVRAEIQPGILPQGKVDVAGAMIGTAGFDWASSGSTILPGAICEHLTSFGGVLRENAGQTPLTEFLRYGAAGSSGTVTEPLAIQAKFPFSFLHVHYARGCSLAEAFYQSVLGPYQLLIVGDPLCQPWARFTELTCNVAAGETLSGVVTIRPGLKRGEGPDNQISGYELFLDGRRIASCGPNMSLEFDSTEYSDGFRELRVVAIAASPIATRSRLIMPIVLDNQGRQVNLSLVRDSGIVEGTIGWNDSFVLKAEAKDAASIGVHFHSQELARIGGELGTVELPASVLGLGPVSLRAVAHYENGTASSRPVEFVVLPPQSQSALKTAARELAEGLRLTKAQGDEVVVPSTREKNWLIDAGVKANEQYSLAAEFRAESSGLYQLQVRTAGSCQVHIDGRQILAIQGSGDDAASWHFAPVTLQEGSHHFSLNGTASDKPALDVRLGIRGAPSLDGKRFRHEPISP